MFVFEDSEIGEVVGIFGIEVVVGLDDVFYYYYLSKVIYFLWIFDVYKVVDIFILCNDYIGVIELCMLFLKDGYCKNNNGKLFLKVCFMFIN